MFNHLKKHGRYIVKLLTTNTYGFEKVQAPLCSPLKTCPCPGPVSSMKYDDGPYYRLAKSCFLILNLMLSFFLSVETK